MKTKNLGIVFICITFLFFIKCKKDDNGTEITVKVEAGNDIVNIDGFSVSLNADSLKSGESGEWSVLKGLVDNKVYFENKKLPKTIFFGLPGENYLLQWKLLKNNKYYYDSVRIRFNPIKIKIVREENSYYSTRTILYVNSAFAGQWTINGDIHQWESTQLGGVIVPKEKYPRIKIFGQENGKIHAKWTVKYGSVSFSDTLSIKTGNFVEYEALEDLQLLGSARCKFENGHVVEINLSGDWRGYTLTNFVRFPALSSLKYLKKLALCCDGLDSFPRAIPQYFKNLEYIDLESNFIEQIPPNIGELKKLTYLNLGNQSNYNKIKTLPESIGDLENLKYLDLHSFNIKDIPNSFGKLTKLEYLYLGGSVVNSIPENFGNLNSLKIFVIDGIKNSLPESFSQLSNLKELHITSYFASTMSKLPENIGNLKKLQILKLLGNNTFQDIPNSFCELYQIEI